MSDLVGTLQAFSAAEIQSLNLALPVKIELMDVSMVPFIEMTTTGPDEFSIWMFEKKALPGTLWKKGPHVVRFTPHEGHPFIKDFSWSPETDPGS